MNEEKVTKPNIETVLERMGTFETRIDERINKFEENVGIRLDRIESVVNTTRGEMLELRADFRVQSVQFRELRADVNELRTEFRELRAQGK